MLCATWAIARVGLVGEVRPGEPFLIEGNVTRSGRLAGGSCRSARGGGDSGLGLSLSERLGCGTEESDDEKVV